MAATLVHKVLGDRLHCVFVDNGLLRLKVGERGLRMGEGNAVTRCGDKGDWGGGGLGSLPQCLTPHSVWAETHSLQY